MQLIDGKAISEQVKQEIAAEVAEIVAKGGKRPHLAAILVGHDGGSETYVAAKVKACEVCGFKSTLIRYEADVTEEELLAKVEELNNDADVDKRLCKPVVVITFGCEVEYPATLHAGIQRVEQHTHQDNAQRHLRLASHQQWEDKRTLEVVQLENGKQHQRYRIPLSVGECPQHTHCNEHGRLHQNPSHFIGNGRPIATVKEVAVTGLKELQCKEYEHRHDSHRDKKCIVELQCENTLHLSVG